MTIPVVFWLVLISSGASNMGNTTVLPVPFSSAQDCINAGDAVAQQSKSGVTYACPMQRVTDVQGFAGTFRGYSYEYASRADRQ